MKHFQSEISTLQEIGQYRQFRQVEPMAHGRALLNANELVNLSSNDYLGLSTDAALQAEFNRQLPQLTGCNTYGACSSRLLTGNFTMYDKVEQLLEQMYGRPALFFNSGYHANMGILPALTSKDDLILSDKLIHASIIDGIRLSSATHLRYRHLDYEQIEKILHEKRHLYRNVFIVTESVFSMDGDCADLQRLVDIKQRYDAFLYVDEAHAVGAMGARGLGLAEIQGVMDAVDLLIGTLGKAYASVGAWVVCDEVIKQLLVNKCRTLIFTTALPPVNMAWSYFIMSRMDEFDNRRQSLQQLWQHLAQLLNDSGISVDAQSHILPVMIGDNHAALSLSQQLQQQGFLVMAVRPPTVPVGTARLRLSLSASISPESITKFAQILIQTINK
jgi:8-amino-7-oxononanoate synthase